MVSNFKPGVYRHYKGGLYRALFLAQDSTNRFCDRPDAYGTLPATQEPCVIYIAVGGEHAGKLCVRTLAQWEERVTITGPIGSQTTARFEFIHE